MPVDISKPKRRANAYRMRAIELPRRFSAPLLGKTFLNLFTYEFSVVLIGVTDLVIRNSFNIGSDERIGKNRDQLQCTHC